MNVTIKSAAHLDAMRVACRLASEVLDGIGAMVRPGVSTEALDDWCRQHIEVVQGAIAANIGYHGFPKTLCTSLNHVVCHGIPSAHDILREGDIVNIDVTVIKNGWHGDTSRMYRVGAIAPTAQRLIDTSYQAMLAGIRQVRPGATLGDIGHAIQSLTEEAGYSVVRNYCGHGIGQRYHEDPQVLHYGKPGAGLVLKPGMVFTIEPMINAGRASTEVLADGWTVVTRDRSLSAQWEHTVAVTASGVEILTLASGEDVTGLPA